MLLVYCRTWNDLGRWLWYAARNLQCMAQIIQENLHEAPLHIILTKTDRASLHTFIHAGKGNALSRHLDNEAALRRQVLAVETERNEQRRGICWQFTSRDARHKLERLYPVKACSSD